MAGWIYLAVAVALGVCLVDRWFSVLLDWACAATLRRTPAPLPRWMITLPAAVVVGLMVMTWSTYLVSYGFRAEKEPLSYGNAISLGAGGLVVLVHWLLRRRSRQIPGSSLWARLRMQRLELCFCAVVLTIASVLMFYTLRIDDNQTLLVGLSVFSDFGPHLAVARSFSFGLNFPTEYPHFPDGHIRYHFLFQFLAGNLEYLGLPIDWAFNVPSILAFTASAMLLYALTVVLVGDRLAGILTVVLFFFRSASAARRFITEHKTICDAVSAAFVNDQFIGRTLHEDWGLWNQNVYLNQRHLPIGLALIFLALILFYPNFRGLVHRMRSPRQPGVTGGNRLQAFLFTADAWLPRDRRHGLKGAAALGFVVGLAGFWNGAAVIALLCMLAVLGIAAWHRLEFVVVAAIALPMVILENQLFLGWGQVAVQPQIALGFLADDPHSLVGVGRYYLELLGVFPFALVLGLLAGPPGTFWIALAFGSPLVLATTVQLTPDIAINHKYVMIAVMLLNIFIALLLARCMRARSRGLRWAAGLLLLSLTSTGVIDLLTIYNKDTSARAMRVALHDPVLTWLVQHTNRKDRLLTDWYALHPVLLAGRSVFYGWPYYAWGAGYPTAAREAIVKEIYGGTEAARVHQLLVENDIDYVVIDAGNRVSKLYKLNEALLRTALPAVYDDGSTVILQAQPGRASSKVNEAG